MRKAADPGQERPLSVNPLWGTHEKQILIRSVIFRVDTELGSSKEESPPRIRCFDT